MPAERGTVELDNKKILIIIPEIQQLGTELIGGKHILNFWKCAFLPETLYSPG